MSSESKKRGRVTAIDRDSLTIWREDDCLTLFFAPGPRPPCELGSLVELRLDPEQRITGLTTLVRRIAYHPDLTRWRKPGSNGQTRMENLRFRQRIKKRTEAWFEERGFLGLDLPVVLPGVNPEAHFNFIHGDDFILSTSPELQMKRMLVGGLEKIYSLAACYRARERSALHNPEFWLLEWYESGASLEDLLGQLESLIKELATLSPLVDPKGRLHLPEGGRVELLTPDWERVPVRDLVFKATGVELEGCTTVDELKKRIGRVGLGLDYFAEETYEQIFGRLWAKSEFAIPRERPVFITDWPAPLASLARLKPDEPWLAERAELVIGGIELSNGFGELLDPIEQAARFKSEVLTRKKQGRYPARPDEEFLASLKAGLPPSAGMALGFDRLVMLLAGASRIEEVLSFSSDEL